MMKKEKQYCFIYQGTLREFNEAVAKCQPDYEANYLFSCTDGKYSFGVARAGHSGGYWYRPQYLEQNGILFMYGEIKYEDLFSNARSDRPASIILWIVLFPLIVTAFIVRGISWIVRKVFHKPKTISKEEKALLSLIVGALGAERSF